MDQPSRSPEPRERAVSSEPCSTRPNPFDDDELSARKRRRTSLSGGASPSRSAGPGTAGSSQDLGAEPPEADLSPEGSKMKVDVDPASPHTPDQGSDGPGLSVEPVSSRVTINLRNTQRPLDTIPSSPLSSKSPASTTQPPEPNVDDVKVSVEESEVDMSQGGTSGSTPISSAMDGGSPPIKVLDPRPDGDFDAVFSSSNQQDDNLIRVTEDDNSGFVELNADDDDEVLEDPTPEFPYRNDGEHQQESVNRVNQHILAYDDVAWRLVRWIHEYRQWAKDASYPMLLESFQQHRCLWLGLPEIVSNVYFRRSTVRDREFRAGILRIFHEFSALTAHFARFDLTTMKRAPQMEDSRPPDLISPLYLQVLNTMCKRDEATTTSYNSTCLHQDEISGLIDSFLNQGRGQEAGGSFACLWKVAGWHTRLLAKFPRLSDNLHHICQLSSLILLYDTVPPLPNSTLHTSEKVRNRLDIAWLMFSGVSTALSAIIEKGITHLSHEHTGGIIKCLGEIMKHALRGNDNASAMKCAEDFRKAHPQILATFIPEVISCQWRFSMFSKLIMSSQMQLRVMAVSEMCADMVSCWKHFSEPQHDPRNVAVQHFFADFLLRSDLISYLLGPTCHPEITSESFNILGFLLVTNTYANEHTDLMWKTVTTTQDPRVSEALLRMVGRIGQLFSLEGLLYLLHKLESLPIEGFTPAVREFADIMLKHAVGKCAQNERTLDLAPYFLCLRLMRESSVMGPKSPVAYPDVRDFANARFKELLLSRCAPDAEGRAVLYRDCMQDIANKSPTTPGSLAATHHLASLFLSREIQMLATEFSFAELLVNELEHAIIAGHSAGYLPAISGQPNVYRHDLIYHLVNYQPMAILGSGLGSRLWEMMVGKGAACQEDRDASWKILLKSLRKTKPENAFLTTCLNEYLPLLPPECFCTGALDLIRAGIMPIINDPKSDVLDDEEGADWVAIEQVWRVILTTTNPALEQQAVELLVNDIYLNSKSIRAFSHHRARKVHLGFVGRCLKQLFSAAAQLKSFGSPPTTGDDEPMVAPSNPGLVQEQSLLFVRSLAVLREFHSMYSRLGHFATPDLRSLPLALPNGVEGDSAELKFQCFDGDRHTDVKELNIGRRNTAASLLASLKEATGFENYRIYYRGQPFVPQEADICKSLEDLHIHNGLILVKREAAPAPTGRIRPGASPVEIEILSHFDKLWECLGMDANFATEIYQFLTRLPADDRILGVIADPSKSPTEVFPVGQTFKSLYAIFAMEDFLRSRRRAVESAAPPDRESATRSYDDALKRILFLAVAAIRSHDVIESCPTFINGGTNLRAYLTTAIMTIVIAILNDSRTCTRDAQLTAPNGSAALVAPGILDCVDGDLVRRLIALLASNAAMRNPIDTVVKLSNALLQTILDCAVSSRVCWAALTASTEIPAVITRLVLQEPRPMARALVREMIMVKFSRRDSYLAVSSLQLEEFFWPLACNLVPAAIEQRFQCEEVFNLWLEMFKSMKDSASAILDLQLLLDVTSDMLLSYEAEEDITQPDSPDLVAFNLAQMLRQILMTPEGSSAEHGLVRRRDLAHRIFWKHLFPEWHTGARRPLPQLVHAPQTRLYLFESMLASIGNDTELLGRLIQDLDMLVPIDTDDSEDPYHYDLPFGFERSKAIRAPCGYVGLRNLSNTCYLNSLFTQLFMNVGFRKFILEADVPDREYSQKLLFQTQTVFGFLQNSLRRYTDPQHCVASIKTYDDTPIDIHNQMDVDEFYNLLFDRWEGQLLTPESKKEFRAFYGGQLVQQVRSKECEHISEILEPFSAIQCDIKGKSSLQESLEAYVHGEIMGGDNKYKCSTCDRHVDAVKRACLKDIPDNLIFHLKRFDFNLRSLTRNKINDYFMFPTRIDMRPYTIEHLSDPSQESVPDIFELVGVLVHSGTAESGHYYSYVRERPTSGSGETWVEFNDDLVSQWDPAHMEASCFGGPDLRSPYDGAGQPYDKTYSAYMLFYQRSSSLAKEHRALAQVAGTSPLRVPMPDDLLAHIQRENMSILRRHCLFAPSHIYFVCAALLAYGNAIAGDTSAHQQGKHKVAIHMALGHLDQVASRQKDVPDFDRILSNLIRWLSVCSECAVEILTYLGERRTAFRMLLQRNPDSRVRTSSGDFFLSVMRGAKNTCPTLYGGSPGNQNPFAQNLLVHLTVGLISELWDHFHLHLRSWHEIFGFMLGYVQLGRQEMGLFLDQNHLRRLVLVIAAETNDPQTQFARMATTVSRRLPNRPPSYENVIGLIAVLLESLVPPRGTQAHDRSEFQAPEHALMTSRYMAACQDPPAPFEITKQELGLIGKDWVRNQGNVFVDKLLVINQNMPATESIIESLVRLSMVMEYKVLTTLMVAINGAIVSHVNQPFLRAAVVFCRRSRNPSRINELFMHICDQCRSLNNNEGRAFLDFHRDVFEVLNVSGQQESMPFARDGLANLHKWVPFLMGYYEPQVGSDVFDFLFSEIFTHGPAADFEDDAGGVDRSEALDVAAQRVAIESLKLLKATYVLRGNQIQKQIFQNFEQLFDETDKYFEQDQLGGTGHLDESRREEYLTLKRDVVEPLQKLTVEDIEDDASEWENSCGSSEQMDSLGDFSMQQTGELGDGDLQ
ncbi:hypothetical protein RB598_005598 [Gaeumannomyces tritici]